MGHDLEKPYWDPLHWTGQYYYESLSDIDQRLGLPTLTNPHISTIEAYTHDTNPADPNNALYL